MPKANLKVGDIVEVVDETNEHFPFRGVIQEGGPNVVVAFTYHVKLKSKQIKKVDVVPTLTTLNTLTLKQLRTKAKEVGVPAVGTRDKLVARIATSLTASIPSTSRDMTDSDFPIGALVQISDESDTLRDKCRGKVIDGPSVTVKLTNKKLAVEEKKFPKSKLTRVG